MTTRRLIIIISLVVVFGAVLFFSNQSRAVNTTISVDANDIGGDIPNMVYGTSIYWGGGANGLGSWVNTQEEYDAAMTKWAYYTDLVGQLGPTVVRIGGGLSGNQYQWKWGIGPIEQRPPMPEAGRISVIGTDEALEFAENLGADPILQIGPNAYAEILPNLTFTFNHELAAREIADWVEYVNIPNDGSNPGRANESCPVGHSCRQDHSFDPVTGRYNKDWAAERAKNGRLAPYNVRYWEFGNELYSMQVADYISAMKTIIPKMREIDPSILIGAVAHDNNNPDDSGLLAWDNTILLEAGHLFDFWIRHSHVGGGYEGEIKCHKNNKTITLPFAVEQTGNYSFSIKAADFFKSYQVLVDGVSLGNYSVNSQYQETAHTFLNSGQHQLQIVIVNHGGLGQYITFSPIIAATNKDTGSTQWLDMRNSPEVYYTIQSVVLNAERDDFTRPYLPLDNDQQCDPAQADCQSFGGKPVFVTEYSLAYGNKKSQPKQGVEGTIRDAFVTVDLLYKFIKRGVSVATHWDLFNENQRHGPIEGVAIDKRGRNDDFVSGEYQGWFEEGRPNANNPEPPHKRPLFYIFKLYKEYFQGQWLNLYMANRSFVDTGINSLGVTTGTGGREARPVYFIDSMSALSNDRQRLTLIINNRSVSQDIVADISINNFLPDSTASLFTIKGDYPGENNDPEDCFLDIDGDTYADCLPNTKCPNGDCVKTTESSINVSNSFSLTVPKLSVNAIILASQDSASVCDLDYSGQVNSQDAELLFSKWLQKAEITNQDINNDGRVDVKDIGYIMSNWSK